MANQHNFSKTKENYCWLKEELWWQSMLQYLAPSLTQDPTAKNNWEDKWVSLIYHWQFLQGCGRCVHGQEGARDSVSQLPASIKSWSLVQNFLTPTWTDRDPSQTSRRLIFPILTWIYQYPSQHPPNKTNKTNKNPSLYSPGLINIYPNTHLN